MKFFIPLTISILALVQICYAPPVTQNKDKDKEKEDENVNVKGLEDYMEYHRYLQEVVNALESDPDFRQKLEKADEESIRSGKIAEDLKFVSHHVRSQLDEIKRIELSRLRELTEKKRKLQKNIETEDPMHRHLDHRNPHTFEIEDLKKLIAKTTADLVAADEKRKEEFKTYEMHKEYEKQNKLNHTNGDEREKLEKEFKENEEKHKKHEKLHEPGHKAQLEEVWQEQDQMQQEFDPKTFFMLHDYDSNGLWDQDEVKALFVKELAKMYAEGEPEDDMRERAEEMERMRESVFKEVDVNRDGFIDYEEFLAQTKRKDFQQDHGWQGIDERRPYTDAEYEEYLRLQQMANHVPPGYPPAYPPVYPGHPGNGMPVHPNAGPMHPNGAPVHPGAVPQQQFHPGQIPQQPPQQLHGQLNTNEVYPHHPNQLPQQNYQHAPQGNYQAQPHQVPPQNYQQPQNPPQQQNYQQQPNPPHQNYQQPQNPPQHQVPQQQQIPQQNYQQAPQQQVPQQHYQQSPPQAKPESPQVNQV